MLRSIQLLDSSEVLNSLMFGMFASDFERAVESPSAVFTARFPCVQFTLEKIALKPNGRLLTVDDRVDLDLFQPINFPKACNEGITLCCGKSDSIQFELAAEIFSSKSSPSISP